MGFKVTKLRLMSDTELKVWGYKKDKEVVCMELENGDTMAPQKDNVNKFMTYSKNKKLVSRIE